MELFSPHLVQKLWPKIWSLCLGGIWEAVSLSAGQHLGSIRVLTHTAGPNLDFNSPQLRYMLIISSCGTLVIQAVKHSWQRYAGLILNQLTPKLPQRDFNFIGTWSKFWQVMLLLLKMKKIYQLTKESGTSLWSALSWAKDDPKKGHRLSLQVHGPTIAKQ